MLKGDFKGKSVIKITVLDEEHLKFEGIKTDKAIDEESVVVHAEGEAV